MPKYVKERRLDREQLQYKASSKYGQSIIGPEKGRILEKPVQDLAGGDINKIWMDAVQKGAGPEVIESGKVKEELAIGLDAKQTQMPSPSGTLNTINPSFNLNRTLSRHQIPPPFTFRGEAHQGLGPCESHNFGENPTYHDEAFQYDSRHPYSSISTPPSPFSSRFYSVNIRKVKGHKRSRSSPLSSPYQTLQAIGFQSDTKPTPHFPLPTLRPVTPLETASTPGTPLLATHDREQFDNATISRYTKQYPQEPQANPQDYRRAQSVPPLDACSENTPNTNMALIEGTRWTSDGVSGSGQDGTFQPVMIFEQGQSVTGQKWKRKVTVFRSDVLRRLEQEGLVLSS